MGIETIRHLSPFGELPKTVDLPDLLVYNAFSITMDIKKG